MNTGAQIAMNQEASSSWEVENVLLVNTSLPEITGKRYSSVANAITYAKTQSPGSTNPWAIYMPAGTYSDNIAVPSYIRIVGHNSGTRLTGQITSEGAWVADVYEYIVENCYITNLTMGSSQALVLWKCILGGGTPSDGDIAILNGIMRGTLDLSSLNDLWTFNATYFGLGTTLSLPASSNIYGSEFSGVLVSINLNGGDFNNTSFSVNVFGSGTYTCKDVTFGGPITLTAGMTLTARNCTLGGNLTVNGGTLNSYGCSGTINYSAGTWNNYGDRYDNRTSGLSATDEQSAIDELAATPSGVDIFLLMGA